MREGMSILCDMAHKLPRYRGHLAFDNRMIPLSDGIVPLKGAFG